MKRFFLTSTVLLILLLSVAALLAWQKVEDLHQPMPVQDAQLFEIPSGANLAQVSKALEREGFIDDARAWYWLARYRKLDRNIKAGEYELQPGLSAVDAMQKFVEGRVVLHSVTFVEGWTAQQALETLIAHPGIEQTLDINDSAAVLAAIGTDYAHLEGLLYPSTYKFGRGTRDVDILRQSYQLLERQLASAWAGRDTEAPLESPYELLTMASIIEKETARDDEREQISGVFARRLKKRMRLETDPTVIYGIGPSYDGDIRRKDLRTDTPYNTYTRFGLTPTPIALAGTRALQAAAHPAPGKTLYFVATGEPDGSHYFSETYEEHEKAVARYLARLRQ
ncbi:MAG: endolytic transglycosylase MltG [Pseudomonadota bacterium]